MFPASLIRHRDPELFFAIVAPIGAHIERACDELSQALMPFRYSLEPIRVIEELKQFEGYLQGESVAEDEKIEGRMDAGDRFRGKTQRNDALAILSLSAVIKHRRKHRSAHKPISR